MEVTSRSARPISIKNYPVVLASWSPPGGAGQGARRPAIPDHEAGWSLMTKGMFYSSTIIPTSWPAVGSSPVGSRIVTNVSRLLAATGPAAVASRKEGTCRTERGCRKHNRACVWYLLARTSLSCTLRCKPMEATQPAAQTKASQLRRPGGSASAAAHSASCPPISSLAGAGVLADWAGKRQGAQRAGGVLTESEGPSCSEAHARAVAAAANEVCLPASMLRAGRKAERVSAT